MYHLWFGLPGGWVASGMGFRLLRVRQLEDRADPEAENPVDRKEENGGEDHHDAHHDRGDPGLLPAGPGHLARLGPHLPQELDRTDALLDGRDRGGGRGSRRDDRRLTPGPALDDILTLGHRRPLNSL